MKSPISFDVDGILADFNRAFAKVLNSIEPGCCVPDNPQPTTWFWTDLLPDEKARKKLFNEAWRKIDAQPYFWYNQLNPLPDAEVLSDWLGDGGARGRIVYFVTNRQDTCGDVPAAIQTKMWLRRFGMWSDHCTVLAVKDKLNKKVLYKALGIKYSIDDRAETVEDCVKEVCLAGPQFDHKPFLYDQPWNRDAKVLDHVRLDNLTEYINIIETGERE